jgi:hypothetical protein
MAQRAVRLRLRVPAGARAAARDFRLYRGVPPRRRAARSGGLEACALARGLGDASRLRSRGLSGDGGAPPGPRPTARRAGGRESAARAARGRAPQHRLLPLPSAGRGRVRARRPQRTDRPGAAGRRSRLRRYDSLRGPCRLPAGDRQLAHDGPRRRSDRGRRGGLGERELAAARR